MRCIRRSCSTHSRNPLNRSSLVKKMMLLMLIDVHETCYTELVRHFPGFPRAPNQGLIGFLVFSFVKSSPRYSQHIHGQSVFARAGSNFPLSRAIHRQWSIQKSAMDSFLPVGRSWTLVVEDVRNLVVYCRIHEYITHSLRKHKSIVSRVQHGPGDIIHET